jgi:hypothetical protein
MASIAISPIKSAKELEDIFIHNLPKRALEIVSIGDIVTP